MNKIIIMLFTLFATPLVFAASVVGGAMQPDCTINPVSMTNYIEKKTVIVDKEVVDSFVVPNHLLFDSDKSVIRPSGVKALREVLASVDATKVINITIVGNTDSNASDEYNLALGQRRADAVKELFLKVKGLNGKVSSTSNGESMPIDTNDTAVGRQKNRRVEITIKHTTTKQVEEEQIAKRSKDVQVFTSIPSGSNKECVYDEVTMPYTRPNWRRY